MKQVLLHCWLVASLFACASAASAQSEACQKAYVWREATPADHICVAPSARAQAAADNSAAIKHTRADGGACVNGYVWREATSADHVCVTPQSRAQALSDNRLAASRVASASSPVSAPLALNAKPPMSHAPAGVAAPGAASPPPMAGLRPRPPVGPPTAPSPGSGPCPNASQWAFDPVANQCVALQACQGKLIWNPDKNTCVPRPPGGVLECLKGWRFSLPTNKCVPPNCAAPLIFNTAKNECTPHAPCPTGFTFNQQSQCVPETYGILEFIVGTGSDDLRG